MKVTKKDLAEYKKMIQAGKTEEALDLFLAKYVGPVSRDYEMQIRENMAKVLEKEIDSSRLNKLITSLTFAGFFLSNVVADNFKSFLGSYYEAVEVTSKVATRLTLRNILDNFKETIKSTMSKTTTEVLYNLRGAQKEILLESLRLKRLGFSGSDISDRIQKFKTEIFKKYPKYKNMMQGKLFINSAGAQYDFTSYMDMSIRTTALNVDRDIEENEALINNAGIVEYYQADMRTVKTKEREICKHILAKKIKGLSLLALDSSTGNKLGILTIAEAKDQGAMGPNCRHSFRQVSEEFKQKIGINN